MRGNEITLWETVPLLRNSKQSRVISPDWTVVRRLFSILLYVAALKGRPAVYILNLVNITNDHISETGVLEALLLTHERKALNLVPQKMEAAEFVASKMAQDG